MNNRLIKLALFTVLLFCEYHLSALQNYSIVFIHIGKMIPEYLEDSVCQASAFNPECEIFLLANQEALDAYHPKQIPNNLICIPCESLIKTNEHHQFLQNTTLNDEWRGGFWRYTSERFLYLFDFIVQYQKHNVFHLEYDNMLYVDLGILLPVFEDLYPGIAATFDNEDRCIPGFVYISNPMVMKILAKCFVDHASDNSNDMQVLGFFKQENDRSTIDHLPIITKEYASIYPLISPMGHIGDPKYKYFQNIDLFNSIFDAAALGQFLGGIDPANGDSEPGFINESCVFNPAFLKIEWHLDEINRQVPFIVHKDAKYRINNLHIHSKNLKLFSSSRLEPVLSEEKSITNNNMSAK